MKHVNRNAPETHLLLDLITYELYKLNLPKAGQVNVHAGSQGLFEDLEDRVWGDFILVPGQTSSETTVTLYLLGLEDLESQAPLPTTEHLIIGFRNRLSHKSLVYADWRGLWYPRLEHQLRRTHRLTAAWGVMGPSVLARLSLAAAANRAQRFDLGYFVADRAMRSPVSQGAARYLCPLGLVVGHRRDL